MTPLRLHLQGITKAYAGKLANEAVDLRVAPGEIHALIGENGAGKSTLMKIVYGVVRADAGDIYWNGERVQIHSPAQARKLGIGMVFQHFSLFETLSVADNIALALDRPERPAVLAKRIAEVSTQYGLPVEPQRPIYSMSVGERQRVEIVRCLLERPRLLIMDEPTSVLTPQAVRVLFATLRQLAQEGVSILYISHKLDEVRELCSRATVLRGGRVSGEADPRSESNASLARMMLGGTLDVIPPRPRAAGEIRLQLRQLSLPSPDPHGCALQQISLDLHGGQIVGIAGVSGNGQKELLAALSGELRTPAASLQLMGEAVGHLGPAQRRARGLGVIPEERLGRGAVPELSLTDNLLLTAAGRRSGEPLLRHGMLRRRAARQLALRIIADFGVSCSGPQASAASLSGGNLQKFIVGREVVQAPQVLLVAQPTWGVDVGAAQRIHQALIALRDQGCAVLILSDELDELFALCDQLAVIAGGRLSPLRRPADTCVDDIGRWMAGQFSDAA